MISIRHLIIAPVLLMFAPQLIAADSPPAGCESTTHFYYGRLFELSVLEHACVAVHPTSADRFKLVLSHYENEDSACFAATRSRPRLLEVLGSKELAVKIDRLKQASLPQKERDSFEHMCLSIVEADRENRELMKQVDEAMPPWPTAR